MNVSNSCKTVDKCSCSHKLVIVLIVSVVAAVVFMVGGIVLLFVVLFSRRVASQSCEILL